MTERRLKANHKVSSTRRIPRYGFEVLRPNDLGYVLVCFSKRDARFVQLWWG